MTTTASGVSDTVSVTGAGFAWTTSRAISIQCDDMDSADGRQTAASPVWDDMMFAMAGSGTQPIVVKSVSVWEA